MHLDTDLGGNPDDACALALLLGWPDTSVIAVTTTLEDRGRRAGCAAHVLEMAGRPDVPVVAGAEETLTGHRYPSTWGDDRYWPDPVEALPSPSPSAALDRLAESIEQGATVVAIGGLTNLARLELERPGALHGVAVVAMGGWLDPLADGLPPWGPARDFNIQCDTRSAEIVLASACDLTLALLPVTAGVHLVRGDLPDLRAAGVVGRLLALQAETYGRDKDRAALARAHEALPRDLLNFHWDPVAAAIAVGWPGATVGSARLEARYEDDALRFVRSAEGRPTEVLTRVAAEEFRQVFLDAVARLP